MTQITARTRPNGKSIVVEAFNADGRKIAETITKSTGYEYLVVTLWRRQAYTATLRVAKRSNNWKAAEAALARCGDRSVLLRRHSDGTYTPRAGWRDRQDAIVRRRQAERWMAERTADRHQVLVDLPDGRTVRVGDPTRHFTYDQALERHEVTPGSYVRSETDPRYGDIEWATRSDLDLVGAS